MTRPKRGGAYRIDDEGRLVPEAEVAGPAQQADPQTKVKPRAKPRRKAPAPNQPATDASNDGDDA